MIDEKEKLNEVKYFKAILVKDKSKSNKCIHALLNVGKTELDAFIATLSYDPVNIFISGVCLNHKEVRNSASIYEIACAFEIDVNVLVASYVVNGGSFVEIIKPFYVDAYLYRGVSYTPKTLRMRIGIDLKAKKPSAAMTTKIDLLISHDKPKRSSLFE